MVGEWRKVNPAGDDRVIATEDGGEEAERG
jgi:hypothetical protein